MGYQSEGTLGEGNDDQNAQSGADQFIYTGCLTSNPPILAPYFTELHNWRNAGGGYIVTIRDKYQARRGDEELAHVIERLDAQMTSLGRRQAMMSLSMMIYCTQLLLGERIGDGTTPKKKYLSSYASTFRAFQTVFIPCLLSKNTDPTSTTTPIVLHSENLLEVHN